MLNRSSLFARNMITHYIRKSHGGTPGENLPFKLGNPYRLTAWFIVFFGSGLAVPFVAVRYQLTKK